MRNNNSHYVPHPLMYPSQCYARTCKLFVESIQQKKIIDVQIQFFLTKHVNATNASRICSVDERKKFIGPNAHVLISISNTKYIINDRLVTATDNVYGTSPFGSRFKRRSLTSN